MGSLFILPLALVIDLLLGEPPRVIHPVAWMGKLISFWERFAPPQGARTQLVYGSIITLLTMVIFALPVYFILLLLKANSYQLSAISIAYVVVGALLLKSAFSFKELRRAALKVKSPLTRGNLDEARANMPALVSRNTGNLRKPELVSATIESVAENTCDSFVAPLFYFLLLGVPGAVAYRVVNTLDAMIGYHGEYEYLGKFPAKLDDILNFVPARIAGLLLVLAAHFCKRDGKSAWQIMLRDHGKTESPNAGWPMSATAGALRIRLEKVGCYSLGNANNPLSPQLIVSGIKLAEVAALLCVLLYFTLEVTYFAFIA